VGQIEEVLTQMKANLAAEGLKVKYVPDDDALAQCYALGQQVAEKLNETCDCE